MREMKLLPLPLSQEAASAQTAGRAFVLPLRKAGLARTYKRLNLCRQLPKRFMPRHFPRSQTGHQDFLDFYDVIYLSFCGVYASVPSVTNYSTATIDKKAAT
ncbi:hypothetical protein EVAR_26724_1 [Eumeta japonica]|uniref:Uncharacterized protein n=1 Tax=Eumeta variegata TaxID=151549 RepID=A0A4C1XBF8_EUMVA|nr:hypothetical protein EVAR_26724_1 [Eumeta japonica]